METDRTARNVGPGSWFTYRGGLGMVMWGLHRVTGVGILLFLVLHIVDIFLISFGPDLFNELLVIYHAPWARVMEVFLLFAVLFHALNGLRIAIQDFWPGAWAAERKLILAELLILAIVFFPAAWLMLRPLFTG